MLTADTEVLTKYDQLGKVLRHFQAVIPEWVDKHALKTAGSRLGLLHGGAFVFAAESEMAVLMDYCLYNMPKDGLNLAAQYMRRNPPLAGSDEELVLNAMSSARHALLSVTKLDPFVKTRPLE